MGPVAAAARELIAAGLSGEALVEALDRIEQSVGPVRGAASKGAARTRLWRERKASLGVTVTSQASRDAPNDGIPNLPTVEGNLNPTTPPIVPPAAKSAERDEQFERFRKAYPKRKGTDARPESRKAFDKAIRGGGDPERIIRAAAAFARSDEGQRSEFVPMSATWLNKGRWADAPDRPDPAPARRAPVERIDPSCWDEQRWSQAISYSRVVGWNVHDLGPPPGDPGCKAPERLLRPADYQHKAA